MSRARESVRIFIDDEFVRLMYHPASRIVHHEFKQFVHGDHFRQVLEQGLRLFEEHGACKWLSDDRGNSAIKPADAEWALHDWAPRVMKAGWKYWAVVMPEKVIGQMNMRRWIQTYEEQGVTVEAFTEPVSALRWLEEKP